MIAYYISVTYVCATIPLCNFMSVSLTVIDMYFTGKDFFLSFLASLIKVKLRYFSTKMAQPDGTFNVISRNHTNRYSDNFAIMCLRHTVKLY